MNRVIKLMSEKQIRENRLINASTVSRETGLSRPTISSWVKDDMKGFDKETIVILCKYFECDIGELLVLEHDESDL